MCARAAAPPAAPIAPDDAQSTTAMPDHSMTTIEIPGPLRSFLRMAGISQEIAPNEVMPLLARNAFLYGYQVGRKTEYLMLADRYVHLARELEQLAGPDGNIRVAGCDDAEKLIHVIGYKFENGCSKTDASLITGDAERAFLTVDSGFPLTKLEQSLQEGTPFVYPYPATRVPILFTENDWVTMIPQKQRNGETLLDVLLNNQDVDRLYSAMSHIDPQTRHELYQAPGLRRLLPFAAIFDFYGGRISIRNRTVMTPGGPALSSAWQNLVGANPHAAGEFVSRLLSKDQGWLAAYFDAMSRASPAQQAHFAEGDRLKRVYDAYRSASPTVSAASGVFPRNGGLLLLLTRLKWGASGEPMVPGSPALWQEVLLKEEKSHHDRQAAKTAHSADSPDRLLESLAAYSNVSTNNGPAQIYLMLSAIDDGRPQERRLSEATARMLADKFVHLNQWYLIFVEFPALDDSSVTEFLQTVDRVTGIQNPVLRSNALGALQAEIGIWQILARQKQIPEDSLKSSWHNVIQPYSGVGNSTQLFDSARKSLRAVLLAANGNANLTQDQIIDLLAGPAQSNPQAMRVHQEMARKMRAVLDDQRLVSFDTLFGLYDGLGEMEHGAAVGDNMLALAGNLREFEMPRPIFTEGERASWSPMVYVSRHAELQVRTDLTKVIKTPGTPAQLEAARSKLAPFLRDTLVGLNYAYYEPPGAQVLHSNPLFVRSHDFSASSIQGVDEVWGSPALVGIGATAGGGAYLIGSLADLPYVLALAEEDFLAPEKVQALIWREMVPELLVNAVLPRWWGVSQSELHAAALYQRAGEELLTAASKNDDLRQKVLDIYSDRLGWGRLDEIDAALSQPESMTAYTNRLLPADLFYLASEFRVKYPDQASQSGPAGRDLDDLAKKDPSDTNPERIAHDFGVPHPTLAETNANALMVSEPFPATGGYVSRLFGESWESSNLYWARLADEKGYSAPMLNVLVPELTEHMIANISATSIDDWPALLRAMNETGEQFRQGKIGAPAAGFSASNNNAINGEDASR